MSQSRQTHRERKRFNRVTNQKRSNPRKQDEYVAMAYNVLNVITYENDSDQLLVTLALRRDWGLLLESVIGLNEMKAIFRSLRKCCTSISSEVLRQFLANVFCNCEQFVPHCCLLIVELEANDFQLVEDVLSVLETSASIQPLGLAKSTMAVLALLETHRNMPQWKKVSQMDISSKISSIRHQFTANVNLVSTSSCSTETGRVFKGYRVSGNCGINFREMSIFPTQSDLSEKVPFLRPNIVKGAYQGVDDYLDVQFRLLRADYVTPLRLALQILASFDGSFDSKNLRAIQDVHFYENVRYTLPRSSLVRPGEEYVALRLNSYDYRRIDWEKSKRLLNGTLLLVSSNHFESIVFATVAKNCTNSLNAYGVFLIDLCQKEDIVHFKQNVSYTVLESSSAYFEAYRHNLAVIQSLDDLPFSRYLVFAENKMNPPKFIDPNKFYKLKPILKIPEDDQFTLNKWPTSEDTLLNKDQLKAVRSAFENELCVIQGPPGTGKTFVGLKIIELMLLNEVTNKPILVVCYTNHALDQILEGILSLTKSLVRVGGRSKVERLDPFNLNHLKRELRFKDNNNLGKLRFRLYAERKKCISSVIKIGSFMDRIQGKAIFDQIEGYNVDWQQNLKLDYNFATAHVDERQSDNASALNEDDDGVLSDEDRGQLEEEAHSVQDTCDDNANLATCLSFLGSYQQHLKQKQTQAYDMLYLKYKVERLLNYQKAQMTAQSTTQSTTRKTTRKTTPVNNGRKQTSKKNQIESPLLAGKSNVTTEIQASSQPGLQPELQPELPPGLQLEVSEWRSFYKFLHWQQIAADSNLYLKQCSSVHASEICVKNAVVTELSEKYVDEVSLTFQCLKFRLEQLQDELCYISKQLNDIETLREFDLVQHEKVIGMTVTGAAKYSKLLKKVGAEIVIIEEAAEVLEAQLIATLSSSTKQLVLIGDHQQLQPSTTVHKLATCFNMQVSLFERLINNRLPYIRLKEQHRMRDEFLALLVPSIYSDYFSHESVHKYENIKGLSKNLSFVIHDNKELREGENRSKSNLFESSFVSRLALYLRMQGYKAQQITILTTYSGQVFAIRNDIRMLENKYRWTAFKSVVSDVGITYREPIDEKKPPSMFEGIRITTVDNYQGEENDIVIVSFVRSNEEKKIGFLATDNRVCVALSRARKGLYCVGNISTFAEVSQTWRAISDVLLKGNYVDKGLELCCQVHNVRLLATNDRDFDKFSEGGCSEPCGTRLNCGHTCPKQCHQLDQTHEEFYCWRTCERKRDCGHPCVRKCGDKCGPCVQTVEKTLECGHDVLAECHLTLSEIECQKPCERMNSCEEHNCKKLCHQTCGKCMEFVDVQSPCGHVVRIVCRDRENKDDLRKACQTEVRIALTCGHSKMVPCESRLDVLLHSRGCVEPKQVRCSRGHLQSVECSKEASIEADMMCTVNVAVKLHCTHQITSPCNEVAYLNLATLTAQCQRQLTEAARCGHIVKKNCHQRNTPTEELCQFIVNETLDCGHSQSRKCNSNRSCSELVAANSPCGHTVNVFCSDKTIDSILLSKCDFDCETILLCGHQCSGNCRNCKQGQFHQMCLMKCGKKLFCGHSCPDTCHGQCKPCTVKESVHCPHGLSVAPCASLINGACLKKPRHCSHVRCQASKCSDCNCFCDVSCNKQLDCHNAQKGRARFRTKQQRQRQRQQQQQQQHRCVGLCNELCVCQICDKTKMIEAPLSRDDAHLKTKAARYLKLPCGHSFEVDWLDAYMANHTNRLLFPKCPFNGCGAQIRQTKRYHAVLARTSQNVTEIYTKTFGALTETQNALMRCFERSVNHRPAVPYDFIEKLIDMKCFPSTFMVQYMSELLKVFQHYAADFGSHVGRVVSSKECQQQLLSDCVAYVNHSEFYGGRDVLTIPQIRYRVDEWTVCPQNHIYPMAERHDCPECRAAFENAELEGLADDFAEL